MASPKRRINPWLLLIVLVLLFTIYRRIIGPALRQSSQESTPVASRLIRENDRIRYTIHARCRMGCRRISEAEVQEVLTEGTVNYSKSQVKGSKPRYALEDITKDGQHVRIVFAADNENMVVVTCIDLDRDWPCDCN